MSSQPDESTAREEPFPSSFHVQCVLQARGLLYQAAGRLAETVEDTPGEDLSGATMRFKRANYQVVRAIRLLESYITDFLE